MDPESYEMSTRKSAAQHLRRIARERITNATWQERAKMMAGARRNRVLAKLLRELAAWLVTPRAKDPR